MATVFSAEAAAAAMTDAAITAVSGSFYCFSSAATDLVLAAMAVMAVDADANVHGTMAVEKVVAVNLFGNGPGGIFGCPSCHETKVSLTETLKLFLPYFPLHIQKLISIYLQFLEFMHTFEMVQNMINHMEEYKTLFETFGSFKENPMSDLFSSMMSTSGSPDVLMSNFDSIKKMMEGSDLIHEFTYVEEPSGFERNGS